MQLHAPEGLPEITASSNLGTLITDHIDINSNDIVCVASTVVSKAEDRTCSLNDFPPGPRAIELTAQLAEETANDPDERFIQAVLEESVEILLESPFYSLRLDSAMLVSMQESIDQMLVMKSYFCCQNILPRVQIGSLSRSQPTR